ncbi:MAG: dienelactone hydrolase family protein [Planctomycetota bacterium]
MYRIPKNITALLVLFAIAAFVETHHAAAEQTAAKFADANDKVMHYWISIPKMDPKAREAKLPLLLFLHGAGERGDNLEIVKKHGPPKLVAAGDDLGMIVVSPQCPKGQRWDTKALVGLIDALQSKHPVDPSRIYVTGLSMGGYGTWALVAEIPDRVAAAIPICGGGDPKQADRLAKVPIWAFHGAKDSVVPAERSQVMVDAIKAAGGDVKLTLYPDAGHDSWTETYNNPDVFEWLGRQRKKAAAK